MARRKPVQLEMPLKAWNATLSCLSLYGFCVLVQRMAHVDFAHSISSRDYFSDGPYGLVVFWFNLSKFPEMMDTVFLVMRKRELTFLHVFHHISVAIYCYATLYYPTYWFALMNTFVHGVMYGYFAFDKQLRRIGFPVMALTIIQIVQMYWGLVINLMYLTLPTTEYDIVTACHAAYGLAMYGSYLCMFCAFFATKYEFKTPVNWFACFFLLTTHIGACFGFARASWPQLLQAIAMYLLSGLGVTAGMHRLWTHRSYKARFPTRFCLAVLASASNQGSIYHWCRDHRTHHKFSDTDADPHDINRGFFYAHVGWLMLKKDQRVIDAGKKLDSSDLLADPIVYWNARLNPILDQVVCFVLPGLYGAWMYESALDGVLIFGFLRWVMVAHATWCVNSVAHSFGDRPYMDIRPCESPFTSLVSQGEGWHNWHHAFPSDYATSEGGQWKWNPTKLLIDILAFIGQAYDRKRHLRPGHKIDRE
jgi:stearoyl-CoA desaturase (delta-9 desaturase)